MKTKPSYEEYVQYTQTKRKTYMNEAGENWPQLQEEGTKKKKNVAVPSPGTPT